MTLTSSPFGIHFHNRKDQPDPPEGSRILVAVDPPRNSRAITKNRIELIIGPTVIGPWRCLARHFSVAVAFRLSLASAKIFFSCFRVRHDTCVLLSPVILQHIIFPGFHCSTAFTYIFHFTTTAPRHATVQLLLQRKKLVLIRWTAGGDNSRVHTNARCRSRRVSWSKLIICKRTGRCDLVDEC